MNPEDDRARLNAEAEKVLAQLRAGTPGALTLLRRWRRGLDKSPTWKADLVAKRKAQRRARGVQQRVARRARKRRQRHNRRVR